MKKTYPSPGLVAALCAGVLLYSHAPSAASQDRGTHVQWVEGERMVQVNAEGEVEFAADNTDVLRISPGGRLAVEEQRRGRPVHRVEFAPAGGELRRTYFADGRRREMDAAARAWLAGVLPEVARESAIGAERRVERLVARGGIAGAVREVRRTRSDQAKRTYYSLLLRRPGLEPESSAQVLEAAARTIASDGDKSMLLAPLATVIPLRSEAVRRAYFAAVASIRSGGDRRRVLTSVLRGREVSPTVAAAALRAAATIQGDGDKAAVLLSLPRGLRTESEVRRSYLSAASTIGSDGDRARVLAYLSAPSAAAAVSTSAG